MDFLFSEHSVVWGNTLILSMQWTGLFKFDQELQALSHIALMNKKMTKPQQTIKALLAVKYTRPSLKIFFSWSLPRLYSTFSFCLQQSYASPPIGLFPVSPKLVYFSLNLGRLMNSIISADSSHSLLVY